MPKRLRDPQRSERDEVARTYVERVYVVCPDCGMPVRGLADHMRQDHSLSHEARSILAYEPDWYDRLKRRVDGGA